MVHGSRVVNKQIIVTSKSEIGIAFAYSWREQSMRIFFEYNPVLMMTWPWWMFGVEKSFIVCGYFEFWAAVLCSTQLATQKFAIVLCPHSSASSFRRFSSSKWWCETSHSAFWVLFVVRASQLSAQWEVWMTDRSQWNVSGPLNKTDTKKTTKNQNIFLDYTTNSNWHSNPWHLACL